MDIPYGRILYIDMNETWGKTLYLKVNSPIICQICDSKIEDWMLDENGELFCPYCEEKVEEFIYESCACGEQDLVKLVVVANNNWGLDNDSGEVQEYNDKLNCSITVCSKSLEKDIKLGSLKLLTAKQSVDKKRMIEWTGDDNYDSSLPMPQWIKDKWPYEEQE